jgi:flagellar basal-body rod protein FlgG
MDGLSAAINGLLSQRTIVDNTANNIANINTTAFKSSRVELQTQPSPSNPVGTPLSPGGGGPQVGSVARQFTTGGYQQTGSATNFAIEGDNGFFEVTLPDGSRAYTRDGSFQLNSTGQLVTSGGYSVSGTPNAPQVFRFANPQGLISTGQNLYQPTDAAGQAQNADNTVLQGYIESSNVDEAQEMVNLIVAQRAYEANIKAIQVADEMRQKVNEIRKG